MGNRGYQTRENLMRSILLALLVSLLALNVGCGVGTAVSTGVKIIQGVQAHAIPLGTVSSSALDGYETIKAGQVTTDVERICPSNVVAEVRMQMRAAFADELSETFPGGGKTLTVNVACRFFKKKSLIGKEGRLDLLVTLVDAERNAELGRFYIEGISESPVHTGVDDMAEGTTRELSKFLKKLKKGKVKDE